MINLEQIRKEIVGVSEDARYSAWLELYSSEEAAPKTELQRIMQSDDAILKILFLRFLGHVDQERAVDFIIQLLQNENRVVSDAARKSFDKNLYNGKLKKLIPLIHSPLQTVQFFAIERLAQGGEVEILNPLLSLLKEAGEELQIEILSALRYLADKQVIDFILPFLKNPKETLRFKAILVFGALFESGYFPVKKILLQAITDPSPQIRRAILWSLRRHPSHKDLPLLMQISLKDPDPMVQQESLMEMGFFPTPAVIHHLLHLLVFAPNRLLILKAEGILLSISPDLLAKGLKGLLKQKETRLRDKALLLFSEFEKNSKPYLRYLTSGLTSAENDKAKIPFIEAMGLVESPNAIPFLEKELKGSYLVAYTAMIAILQIWRTLANPPVLEYLKNETLHPLLKQMILKYLVRKGTPEMFSEEMVALLAKYLKSENTNVRYLAAQALVVSARESAIHSLFEMILAETDSTALQFLEENILRLLIQNPLLFPSLMEQHLQDKHAVEILFTMMKMGNIPSKQILMLLPLILQAPLRLMQTEYAALCIDFTGFVVLSRHVTLEAVLRAIEEAPDKGEFVKGLSLYLQKYPDFRFFLSAEMIKHWLETSDASQKEAMILLLGQSEGDAAVSPLVSIVCDDSLKNFHKKASASLGKLLETKP